MGNVREYGPIAAIGATVGGLFADGGFLLSSIAHWLISTVDLWLPVASTFANTLAPRIPWIPQGVADTALVAIAVVFVLVLLSRIARRTFD